MKLCISLLWDLRIKYSSHKAPILQRNWNQQYAWFVPVIFIRLTRTDSTSWRRLELRRINPQSVNAKTKVYVLFQRSFEPMSALSIMQFDTSKITLHSERLKTKSRFQARGGQHRHRSHEESDSDRNGGGEDKEDGYSFLISCVSFYQNWNSLGFSPS